MSKEFNFQESNYLRKFINKSLKKKQSDYKLKYPNSKIDSNLSEEKENDLILSIKNILRNKENQNNTCENDISNLIINYSKSNSDDTYSNSIKSNTDTTELSYKLISLLMRLLNGDSQKNNSKIDDVKLTNSKKIENEPLSLKDVLQINEYENNDFDKEISRLSLDHSNSISMSDKSYSNSIKSNSIQSSLKINTNSVDSSENYFGDKSWSDLNDLSAFTYGPLSVNSDTSSEVDSLRSTHNKHYFSESSQYVIPIYGDITDSSRELNEDDIVKTKSNNFKSCSCESKFHKDSDYKTEDNGISILTEHNSIYKHSRTLSWLNKSSTICSCSECQKSANITFNQSSMSHNNHHGFRNNQFGKNFQSTPIRKTAEVSDKMYPCDMCENCIKKRLRELSIKM